MKTQFQVSRGLTGKLLVIAGSIWILAGLAFLLLVLNYLLGGAGLQLFGFLDVPGSLLIGWVHVTGFFIAAGLCLAIGIVLCAHGVVPRTSG